MDGTSKAAGLPSGVVFALGEKAIFKAGDRVRVATRSPIGHYRVPTYLRGKIGTVEKVIEPAAIEDPSIARTGRRRSGQGPRAQAVEPLGRCPVVEPQRVRHRVSLPVLRNRRAP